MRRIAFFAVTAVILAAFPAHAQSLNETFYWMSNTLNPAEGNNYYVHHPFPDRSQKNLEDGVEPRVMERITEFSHNGCSVKFEVYLEFDDTTLNGTYSAENDMLTFNLKDLDPQTINIEDSCKPVAPGWGAPFNCEDMQGTQVNFKTTDAKPRIHMESIASGGKTLTCSRKNAEDLDDLCKAMPGNTAYCGFSNAKSTKDETQDTLGFTTPEYAKRFAKALRHAVTLCGGDKSTF
jgi:hypothetical protein